MNKKRLLFLTVGIFIWIFLSISLRSGWLMNLQNHLQNYFYDFDQASSKIVIIDIDEKTLSTDALGPLNQWPRTNYAKAVEILNREKAKVIGIDITFPDKSSFGENDDMILAQVLKNPPSSVLGIHSFIENNTLNIQWPNEQLNSDEIHKGWLNIQQDTDGFIRKLPIFNRTKKGVFEAFSVAIARKYLDQEIKNHEIKNHTFSFSDSIQIPVISKKDETLNLESHLMNINYFSEPFGYTHVSMIDLIKEDFIDKNGKPVNFEGKIVLIGPTAIDLQDYYLSPVSQGVQMPGVEIHANAIQTIIENRFLSEVPEVYIWIALTLLLIINLALFCYLNSFASVATLILQVILYPILGFFAYEQGLLINIIYLVLTVLMVFVGSFLLRFFLVKKERKFVEDAFGHYVSKDLVSQITQNPKLLELGGVKKEVTAFFSDIEGFTSISEELDPVQLVNLLNEYLSEMTSIIIEHKGTLDKYEGDAIMAFWGAPIQEEKHAYLACMSALKHQKKLNELRKKWSSEGLPPVKVRIGINTGEVIVGNMGSKERFDYTIMGDNVNLASRLEGINKHYGTSILISEKTFNLISEDFICREIDRIRVKGKTEPITIYELIDEKKEIDMQTSSQMSVFSNALSLYRKKNFIAAEQEFKKLPNDPVAQVFAGRCEHFLKNPPDLEWDGAHTFLTK